MVTYGDRLDSVTLPAARGVGTMRTSARWRRALAVTLFEIRTLELELRQRWRYTGDPADCVTGLELLQSTPTGYDREIFARADFAVVARVFGHARRSGLIHGRLAYMVALRPPETEGMAPRAARPAGVHALKAPACGCCYCKAVRAGVLPLARADGLATPGERI